MNLPAQWRRKYGSALGLAVCALVLRLAVYRTPSPRAPYFTFFLAAAGSAALGGFLPGAFAVALGLLFSIFVVPGSGWMHLYQPSDPTAPLRFIAAGLIVSWLFGTLYSSRERARNAEARLRESERLYRAIGESIPFGIWICDPQGRNTYVSESFLNLIGMTQEECSSLGWRNALHPDEADRAIAAWQECVRTNGVWDVEHRFRGKDGKYHPVLARGVPVRDDRGKTVCWAGINLDIRRLKDAEAQLERHANELKRSNRELEQFAFAASHDMREPLRIVNIYTELLLKSAQKNDLDQMGIFAANIHQGVDKLERLIRDLLHMSRAIHEETQRRLVSADDALDQAVSILAPLIGESEAVIERDPLPFVLADEGQLTQVFQNLLSNAMKYRKASASPRVRITAQPEGEHAVFTVEDNGIGFEPEYAQSIFGLFKRLHGREYEGTGIGLAICQRIVERYGGRIWAESTPEAGSKFYFTLPLASGARVAEPVQTVHASH
jgi:PAS domain S-box-containing protein